MTNDPNENQVSASEPAPVDQGASEIVDNNTGEVANQQPINGTESSEPNETQTSSSDSDQEKEYDENFEWDGNNADDLPKPLQKRAKDMLRHMHKVSQEAAQVKRYADAYNQIVNHPEFKEFLDWKEGKSTSQQQSTQDISDQVLSNLSEEDLLEAQADPKKFSGLLQNAIKSSIQPYVQQFQKYVNVQSQKQLMDQANRQLNDFATKNPDFWDIDPIIMKSAIQEQVVGKKGTIEDAYKYAKNLEKKYLSKAQVSMKEEINKKKKAVSNPPSKSASPDVTYIKGNKQDAIRAAFENASLGKKVDVRRQR